MTVSGLTQTVNVVAYPTRPSLLSSSTLFRLELKLLDKVATEG